MKTKSEKKIAKTEISFTLEISPICKMKIKCNQFFVIHYNVKTNSCYLREITIH